MVAPRNIAAHVVYSPSEDKGPNVVGSTRPHPLSKTTAQMGRAAFYGALADSLVSNPFHVVKTRLQVDTARSPSMLAHCRAMQPADFLRGTSLNLVSTVQRRVWCYSVHHALTSAWERNDKPFLSAPMASFSFGLIAGMSEAFITNPTRRAMLLQQSQNHVQDARTPWQAMRLIMQREGVRGFWLGAPLTAARNGVASGTFFLGLSVLKGFEGEHRGYDVINGAVAAAAATVVSNPADAVKTRIQDHTGQARSVFGTAMHMWKHEGARSFMKGTSASLLRGVPATTIGFVVTRYALDGK